MKAILHIGMHKTGSSSIQVSFSTTPPEGIAYPELGGRRNHSFAVSYMFRRPNDRLRIALPEGAAESREEVMRALVSQVEAARRTPGARAVMLSAEGFCTFDAAAVGHLKRFVDRRFDEVDVYAYVRDPIPFAQSSIQQKAKRHGGWIDLKFGRPDYRARFEAFERAFGAERVHYRLFRRERLKGGDVVLDLCDWIGAGDYDPAHVRSVNEGMSVQAMSALIAYNSFYGAGLRPSSQTLPLSNALLGALEHLPGERWHLSPDLAAQVVEGSRDDIAWMNERLDSPLLTEASGLGRRISGREDVFEIAVESFPAIREALMTLSVSAKRGGKGSLDAALGRLRAIG